MIARANAPLPSRQALPDPRKALQMYDASDLPWLTTLVDHIVGAVNEPWRVLRERLEHTAISAPRVTSILGALRRVTGGRAERMRIARTLRARVLGHPALDTVSREERLLAAAQELGIGAEEVANLLWIDLANERPVTLPQGRPGELQLAAFANLDKIMRAMRRAREVRIRVWGDAHELIRAARRNGLLASVLADGDATVLAVIGPLELFHATVVYGRALASLAPLLADHARFEVELDCDFGRGPAHLRVASPVLLPPVTAGRGTSSLASRLVKDLAALAPDLVIERDPPPIAAGPDRLFPDLRIGDHVVEIVGFATASFLARRLERYAAGGVRNVVLCVDEQRSAAITALANLVPFRKRIDAHAVLAAIGEGRTGVAPAP